MYSRILVPLDGSTRAEKILPHVEELARRFEAQVICLYVVEPIIQAIDLYEYSGTVGVELRERTIEEAKKYINSIEDQFNEKNIEASVCVESGSTVSTIIKVAEREDVDLIAMASHGRSGLSHVFYGSVTIGVLHRVDRPLLIVRSV
jgi:nucleotide-binding universal stress UspA family protein